MTDSAPLITAEADDEDLGDLLLEVLPGDGSTLGNQSAREALSRAAERPISEDEYEAVKERLLGLGLIRRGQGRGGSIRLAEGIEGGSRYEAPAAPASGNGRGRGRAKKEPAPKDFKAVLWASADKLRAQMDAAEYKHLVLGLIFLKFISDTFAEQQARVLQMVSDPDSDYYVGDDPADHQAALEDRDYFKQDNVFWVPEAARWEVLRAQAKQPDIGPRIDAALAAIENENEKLRGKLDRRFGRAQLEPGRLGELVDLISTIGFKDDAGLQGDPIGKIYEYFLGQFALAEGKKGGEFLTPPSGVRLLVAVLAPHKGRVYDPCCGSGGMFVSSEEFVVSHGGRKDDISIYGQESNPTTWRLAAMNLAIRGFAADLGQEPADTFARDQHPDQRFDHILANPPFNISDWGGEKYENDPRWQFGRPPAGNANTAWLQHILWKLRPGGQAGVILANGSMSSNQSGEGQIREAMVRGDVVEVMVALPSQLFFNTQIPACIWFLCKDKTQRGRDRRGETLFIDARQLGSMTSRTNRELTQADIDRIAGTVHAWRQDGEVAEAYADVPGFCYSARLEEIEKNGFVLTPGRYVGAADQDEDDEPFDQKMKRLTALLKQQQEEGAKLDQHIAENMRRLGYEF